jgi:hypothetical protein
MLVQSSLANRTSPVLRGKWVMEVVLGTPPPPPPPEVNTDLDTSAGGSKDGRLMTTRERMEIHRKSATCKRLPSLHGSDRACRSTAST